MKVLFLTHRLPYAPNRGDRIRAYYLLREMSRFADVTLFSLVHDDDEVAHARSVPFARRVETVRVRPIRNAVRGAVYLTSRRPLTHCLLDARDARPVLKALVEQERPDVVVAYCSGMARFALEPPLADLPFVLDMVDVDSVKWSKFARASRPPRSWIYRREEVTLRSFEARATRHAATTLVVNERERRALVELVPDANVVALGNGTDLATFAPSTPPVSDPTVIFCGVMDYYPNEQGIRWFADAVWPRVRRARPDARLLIVGARPGRSVRELAVHDSSIEVTGRVDAVQPYLWRSSVSVAPLHLAGGLQNKVLEALAAGLPVVATPAVTDGLPAAVRAACETRESPESFAEAVVALLQLTPQQRRQRAAAATLDGLDWAECFRPIGDILRAVQHRAAGIHHGQLEREPVRA